MLRPSVRWVRGRAREMWGEREREGESFGVVVVGGGVGGDRGGRGVAGGKVTKWR